MDTLPVEEPLKSSSNVVSRPSTTPASETISPRSQLSFSELLVRFSEPGGQLSDVP